jgi:hypothetical protein
LGLFWQDNDNHGKQTINTSKRKYPFLELIFQFEINPTDMHSLLLATHSIIRYFLLITLILIIVRSLMGWLNKTPYTKFDDKLGFGLFMLTHTQLLLGVILFFVSPIVIFSAASMKDATARYWLVEHNTGMVIAIVLITMARITAKKMADAIAKHKRMFIFNAIALAIILLMIVQSKRGFFGITY